MDVDERMIHSTETETVDDIALAAQFAVTDDDPAYLATPAGLSKGPPSKKRNVYYTVQKEMAMATGEIFGSHISEELQAQLVADAGSEIESDTEDSSDNSSSDDSDDSDEESDHDSDSSDSDNDEDDSAAESDSEVLDSGGNGAFPSAAVEMNEASDEESDVPSGPLRTRHETSITELPIPALPSLVLHRKHDTELAGTVMHIQAGGSFNDPMAMMEAVGSQGGSRNRKKRNAKKKMDVESAVVNESQANDSDPSSIPTSEQLRVPNQGEENVPSQSAVRTNKHPTAVYTLIVQSSPQCQPFDEGSVLVLDDRRIVGVIEEVFGPVASPYYFLRIRTAANIPTYVIEKERKIAELDSLDFGISELQANEAANNVTGLASIAREYDEENSDEMPTDAQSASLATESSPSNDSTASQVFAKEYETLVAYSDILPGTALYACRTHSRKIHTEAVRLASGKGTDASNLHDEEIREEEQEFSDDEEEARFKQRLRAKRDGKMSENSAKSGAGTFEASAMAADIRRSQQDKSRRNRKGKPNVQGTGTFHPTMNSWVPPTMLGTGTVPAFGYPYPLPQMSMVTSMTPNTGFSPALAQNQAQAFPLPPALPMAQIVSGGTAGSNGNGPPTMSPEQFHMQMQLQMQAHMYMQMQMYNQNAKRD